MALGDSFMTGIALVASCAVMLIAPVIMIADKTDSMTQSSIQTETTNFTNDIITKGVITQEDYDNFVLTLSSHEIAWDLEITVQKQDVNPVKKSSGDTNIGDGASTIYYTTQIVDNLPFKLNEGDLVSTKVKSKSETIFSQLTGADSKLIAEEAGMCTYSGTN